jgi:hypothetical protein
MAGLLAIFLDQFLPLESIFNWLLLLKDCPIFKGYYGTEKVYFLSLPWSTWI